MSAATLLTDEWIAAERSGKGFTLSGEWGHAVGVVVNPPQSSGWLSGVSAQSSTAPVIFLAPQWPGLEHAEESAFVDDALAVGLLRAGASVARLRSFEFVSPASCSAWIEVIAASLQAVSAGNRPSGLAGSWLAGTACALASNRVSQINYLLLAGSPSAEVMCRRTAENENDPIWSESPSLRLADQLADFAPLEAITKFPRPTLFVQGAADSHLPATHLEAWRAALMAAGRSCDAIEIAFVDSFFVTVPPIQEVTDAAERHHGHSSSSDEEGRMLLAETVSCWMKRVSSPREARPAR